SGDENAAVPPLYAVGCAGRITSFSETDDGRMMIVLTGLCRFRVAAELPSTRLYRSVTPDWTPYHHDLVEDDATAVNRDRLFGLLQIYFKKHGIGVDWKMVQNAPDDVLVSTAIMISPLPVAEKQALLEAMTFADRAKMLEALLEMAVMPQGDAEGEMRH
ncbi:MAG: LON peptidase substrate-binding domain-containing protein, partial [Alphaproteobacteria bacterium]|nr:LON peptidase substrate-binding domain-containing protein [Alphaproteobacteria bacterium]